MSLASDLASAIATAINTAALDANATASFVALPRRNVTVASGYEINVSPDWIESKVRNKGALTEWTVGMNISVLKTFVSKAVEPARSIEIAECECLCEKIMSYFSSHSITKFGSSPVKQAVILRSAFKPLFADGYVNAMQTYGAFGEFEFTFFTGRS